MDLTLNAADLAFVLCGLIVALGTLLVWAIRTADRWNAFQRPASVRRSSE